MSTVFFTSAKINYLKNRWALKHNWFVTKYINSDTKIYELQHYREELWLESLFNSDDNASESIQDCFLIKICMKCAECRDFQQDTCKSACSHNFITDWITRLRNDEMTNKDDNKSSAACC